MSQLSFNFDLDKENLEEELIICQSNLKIFKFLDQYKRGVSNLPNIFALIGPQNSGKTSFTNLFKNEFNAISINEIDHNIHDLNHLIKKDKFYYFDDIDKNINYEFFFHLINIIKERSSILFLTSSVELSLIKYDFSDLESRIKNIYQLKINNPDYDLVKILFTKYFAKKQLKVETKIVDYLTSISKRDFKTILDIAQKIEIECFRQKKKITIPFVKNIITIHF